MSNTVKVNICPKCGLPISAAAPQALCPKCVLLGAAHPTEAGASPTGTSEIPSLERIAAAFPQLEVVELIGRGGMGFVFKARQPHLDRFVALKLLPDQLAADAQFAERFNREGRVLARLNHPNIVSVFDFGQTGGFYYLLMEFVDGVNLRQAMRTGRFSPSEALAIVPKICEALQYAHEQGILHRDIKPENILLDTHGRVKIADFGIAKLVGEDRSNANLTRTGATLGTPHYMAPEQLEKPTDVDHRADIYSLGVVFYEMLTGELPLGRFAPPSARTPVNATVDEVVLRTLEKDRERRFQSAGEMKTQVEHLGSGEVIHATHGWAARQLFGHRRGLLKWIFLGLLVLGLGAILISRLRNHPTAPALAASTPSEAQPAPAATTPVPAPGAATIQFTFTSVDLREDAEGRWLTMDFVEQVRGNAERTFRYDARVPNFTPTSRTESFMSDAKTGFEPVRHQRVLWKLPDSLALGDAQALRDVVGKEWERKSVAIGVDDERVLFKTLVPNGGTLACLIGVRAPGPVETEKRSAATLRLIWATDHKNIAIARLESLRSHPLHKLVVRLRGPEISDQASRAPSLVSGPLLVPSVGAENSDYVDGSILWGTNKAPIASAVSFECPGDYSLQFVLPDDNLARDAAKQISESLRNPARLEVGRSLSLFTVDQWSGSLEIRPFHADPEKLSLFLHPGTSPADIPGTNRIESAVITVPPQYDLAVTVQPVLNGMNTSRAFQGTLPGLPNKAGIYWLTWYGLPNPQSVDRGRGSNTDWELQIHDENGREIQRVRAPEGTGIQWDRRWLTENRTANPGQQVRLMVFQKRSQEPGRGPTMVLLDMVMRLHDPLRADQ
jgi:predicted Ser/Thr protein kinase